MQGMAQTVRFKITLTLTLCIILMAAIGGFGGVGLSRINALVTHMYSGTTIPIIDLNEVRASQLEMRLQYQRMLLQDDPDVTLQATAAIKKAGESMHKAWHDYYPARVADGPERAVADKINKEMPLFDASTDAIVTAAKASMRNSALQRENQDYPATAALAGDIANDIDISRQQGLASIDQSAAAYRNVRLVAAALVAAGLLIAFVSGYWLLRAVTRPLDRAIRLARQIAEGRLGSNMRNTGGGEFGRLLSAIKTMDGQLSSTVHRIQISAESVSTASAQIASGNMDLSSRTEEQAASLEQTAASMTQLTETVKQNADNARQANELAGNAASLADTGDEAVRTMVGTIEAVSNSSTRISDITGVIEGIAFQTNILALNAAVEAARAGEQGRGFAVVASEVRTLAQRSASAAKEIKDLIGSSVILIENSAKQASQVGTTMGEVRQSIRNVSQIVAEISNASDEQSRGIDQIGTAVSQMDQMTQQNAALVEQAAAAAQSLQEQAQELTDAVSYFKFAGAAAQPAAQARQIAVSQSRPIHVSAARPPERLAAPATRAVAAESPEQAWESF
ncbi:MAG: methyl-accepting chemotaxis protein [Bordetella sp.]|uniref:methyl-accepting chemotaxis protein n=1 Tax=Bordetella sp. TaxID=28081 RepID=UPI003F7C4984